MHDHILSVYQWTTYFYENNIANMYCGVDQPFLHIIGPVYKEEEDCVRSLKIVCSGLCDKLEQDITPKWFIKLKRSDSIIKGPNGLKIIVAGPIISSDPPYNLWEQDNSDAAKTKRSHLLNILDIEIFTQEDFELNLQTAVDDIIKIKRTNQHKTARPPHIKKRKQKSEKVNIDELSEYILKQKIPLIRYGSETVSVGNAINNTKKWAINKIKRCI